MKTRLLLAAFAMFLCAMATAATQRSGLIKATYETTYGKMSLAINLDTKQVTGFYGGDGKILATINDNNRVSGVCVRKELGTMELDFTKDFKSFTGKFGLGTNLTGGVWKGECLSIEKVDGAVDSKPIERKGVYEADYNTEYGLMKLTINFNKNEVSGTYGRGGTITGKLSKDNRLIGTWGRTDRGRMEFDFTADFKNFTGKWGEKDNTLTDGTWMGESTEIRKIK